MKSEKYFKWTLVAFCGSWLLLKELAGPFLIVLLVLALIGRIQKQNQFVVSKQLIAWSSFFFLYVLSLTWAQEPDPAAIERKLALLAFPLLFAFRWKNPLPIAQMWLSHLLACIVLIGIAFYDAIQCQLSLGTSVRCFSTTYFSQVHHPSYFSAFLLFAIIGLLYKKIAWFESKPRWISWGLIALFAYIHLHLGSLAGILGLLCIFFVFATQRLLKKIGLLKSMVIAFGMGVFGMLGIGQSSEIRADASNAAQFTRTFLNNPAFFVRHRQEPLQGNEVRLILWTAATEIGWQQPFGTGVGGLEPAFTKKLTQWGYPEQAKKEFNPHNQYLQVWNEIGWLGLALFLTLLGQLVVNYRRQVASHSLLFLAIFGLFCSFESMLYRESGIVFFSCWLLALSTPILAPEE
ncbi:MAG: hypothetical protein RLZZ301_1213 [Bacteroidota bacterium]|jgi:O-antigen ligase